MRNILKSKIYVLVFLIASTVIMGVIGYMLIEGYNLMDALYMTIITISTTGFEEVKPLSAPGRVFTMILLVVTLSILAYSLASLSSYLMDGDFLVLLRRRRVRKKVKYMENHIIICGYGRNGKKAAEMLQAHSLPFAVIEKDPQRAALLRENNIPVFEENALEDEVLKAAGIDKARALLSALPDDTDNLYIILSAREMNKNLILISRASNDSAEKKLRIAGATDVVKPDTIGGTQMAQLVINRNVTEFIDFVSYDSDNVFQEVNINHFERLWEKPLREIRKNTELDISVIGLKEASGKYILNPSSKLILEPGQRLIIMATPEQFINFKKEFG